MDCKVTLFISDNGNYPYKRYVIDAMLWDENRKIIDNKKENSVKIYIDTRKNKYDYIKANNYNIILKGELDIEITNSNDMKQFVIDYKPYLINSISRYDGNLSHLIIGAK